MSVAKYLRRVEPRLVLPVLRLIAIFDRRLGRVEVSCEGYDHADDDYVLKGKHSSAGVTSLAIL